MKRSVSIICCLAILAAPVSPALAQSEFKKSLLAKYGFKSVSCYTCHMRSADVPEDKKAAFKAKKKAFRNAFGKAFDGPLKGKDVTKRLADAKDAAKKLDENDPKKAAADAQVDKVKEEITKEFLEALILVEAAKSADGTTYGDLLKKAAKDPNNETLDGIKSS